MSVNYKLAGKYVNPLDRRKITIDINHDQGAVIDQVAPHVSVSNLSFANEDVVTAMGNLLKSPGITEGIPLDIEVKERGKSLTLNMYVDCMNGGFSVSKDGFNAGIKMLQSRDWLNDRVDGFTFESLYNETGVKPFVIIDNGIPTTYTSYKQFFDERFIFIPYVISTIPNSRDAFMAIFAITYVAVELKKNIKDITKSLTPSVSAVGPVVHIAQLIIDIAFSILLIIALISLIKQLINCLIQPIKYHAGMLMGDMLKITAAKLGLESSSSIYDNYPFNQLAYLPEKYAPPPPANPSLLDLMGFSGSGYAASGYTSPNAAQRGYFNGVGGDFLRLAKQLINGKFTVPNQTSILQLERKDTYPANTPFQMPKIRQDFNGYNVDELQSATVIRFLADLNEKNCIDKYEGTVLEATHQQIQTNDLRLVCLKGLREITLPVARGVAKTDFTFIEKAVNEIEVIYTTIANGFIEGIDLIIQAVNVAIAAINIVISILNAIIAAVVDVINVVIDIVDAISSLFGGSGPDKLDVSNFTLGKIPDIPTIAFLPLSNGLQKRLNTLLLENDFVTTPKLLLVDTGRAEFQTKRIAYLHQDNSKIVNAKYILDNFYCIDMFCDTPDAMNGGKLVNNRRTNISPSLNHPDEKNPCLLTLSDVLNLINNPKMLDLFSEEVIAKSIQWNPETGRAEFDYSKEGWLADAQNNDATKRKVEIYNNLKLQISIPNGQ